MTTDEEKTGHCDCCNKDQRPLMDSICDECYAAHEVVEQAWRNKAYEEGREAGRASLAAEAEWPKHDEDDRPLPEDAAIKAAHPTRTGRHDLYGEAMRLVGAKRSKGALVALVNWLLTQRATEKERIVIECAEEWAAAEANSYARSRANTELESAVDSLAKERSGSHG